MRIGSMLPEVNKTKSTTLYYIIAGVGGIVIGFTLKVTFTVIWALLLWLKANWIYGAIGLIVLIIARKMFRKKGVKET